MTGGTPVSTRLETNKQTVLSFYVLMFQPDPVELLHRVAGLGRGGGTRRGADGDTGGRTMFGHSSAWRPPSWEGCYHR